jgi:hypothetical protein
MINRLQIETIAPPGPLYLVCTIDEVLSPSQVYPV